MLRAQLMDSLSFFIREKQAIDARLESRLGFIGDRIVSVSGVRLGAAWKRKLRIGGGFSWLESPVKVRFAPFRTNTGTQNFRFLRLAYLCYYMDFVFYKTKRWQLSVPLQAGPGLLWHQEKQVYRLFSGDIKYFFFLYEPGITAQFKVFTWLGLGNDVAYRFIFRNNKTHTGISSPTFSFKLLFWPDHLFYEMFPRSNLTRKFGPAYW